jgi:ribonuclease R
MGARVRVQVSRVDLDGRKIDFRMVRDGDGERLLQRGQGGKAPAERADKVDSAAAELAAVKQADRASRGAAKAAKASQGGGKGVGGHPARARKPGPQRPAPRPRTRR